MPDAEPVLSLSAISKRFDDVLANDDVDLDLYPGEVHAVVGENGAGKSTLMNIVSGVYVPDEGTIRVHGRETLFASPADAVRCGIGMVHQHFRLIPRFTVAENVHLGLPETPRRVSSEQLETRTRELGERYGIDVNPTARVVHLSVGEQQRVEILRTLARDPEVLILDEPTAVLTPQEVESLFDVIRLTRGRGTTVVLIAHKLDEVMAIADRVTVLRRGRRIATLPRAECDRDTLVSHMLGEQAPPRSVLDPMRPGAPVLRAENVSALGDRGNLALADIELAVHAHEIVGVAGIAGNGQPELSEVLTGLRRASSGRVVVGDKDVSSGSPLDFIRAGVGHIPEDRRSTGLVLGQPVWANAVLKAYRSSELRHGPLLSRSRAHDMAGSLTEGAKVSIPSLDAPVDHLSGGNAQRLIVARENRIATHALVAVHPTRGLDLAATEQVRSAILEARRQGLGILLISEDLDEVMTIADRILVLCGGRLMGEFDRASADRQRIGMLMSGVADGD